MVSAKALLFQLVASTAISLVKDIFFPPTVTFLEKGKIVRPQTTTEPEVEDIPTSEEVGIVEPVQPAPFMDPSEELRTAVISINDFLLSDDAKDVLGDRYDPVRDAMIDVVQFAASKQPVDIVTVVETFLEIEEAFPDELDIVNLLKATQAAFGVPNVGDVLSLRDAMRPIFKKSLTFTEVTDPELRPLIITDIPEEFRIRGNGDSTTLIVPPIARDNQDTDTSLNSPTSGGGMFSSISTSPLIEDEDDGYVDIALDELHALQLRDSSAIFARLQQCIGDNFAEEAAAVVASISWAPAELKQAFVDLSLEITNARDKTKQAYKKPKRSK